ncbi:hypothetical protein ES332_A13G123400v1 [Gossypium tomentosum]|uniref:NB-ARC domain-containing protein n=1 Tax=Gossypium tomentosum TaxID=34277 RepID=A0A5D2MJ47_GOSTO|nr:hypothetical protein ES332_A13G123400v1 [Gossypium tomentosum]
MAESFLFNIAERVLEKIAHLSVEEARLAFNFESHLRKLKETLSRIKAVLLDAERQQHQNEKLRLSMWKLRDIFYDAEDVIDDFKCEALRKQVVNHPNITFKVRFLASCSLPLSFSLKMGHKIEVINQRLNELAIEWDNFNLGQGTDNRHVFNRETHSFVNSKDVIGRDVDKENIVDLLMKPSEGLDVPVIPIVGIGGIGKTTLTRLVYNDNRVNRHFPLKIWICVSEEFDLTSLLNDKKFLLVLDDVWNENQARWIELRDLLRSMGGLSQSKIIVTTRSLKVASIMSSISPYELKVLPHEDCLILFTKWAFNDGDDRKYPNLMRIGEEIVKKCKGVPSVVRTLGSLLFLKTDEFDWISVRDNEIWKLEHAENEILPVLKLSYNHLPSHLQRCFAVMSLYKKDSIYYSDKVIQFWMANGLLEHSKQKQEWVDVGGRYLNELLSRCLIQKETDYALGFTFKMHDLIHDLALDVSQKECKTVNSQSYVIDENVRHLSFCDDKLLKVPQDLKKLKNVRTVFVHELSTESKTIHESIINLCVSKFKYLRALHLRCSPLTALPNLIGTLKHLRDLDLTGCRNIQKLPSSFYKLRSLQTLRMYGIPLMQLPVSMESLIELRYLEITIKAKHVKETWLQCWAFLQYLGLFECDNLECLPEGMQYLTSLRRLVLFGCPNLVSLPRSLKHLTKLEKEDKDLQLSLKTFSIRSLGVLTDLPQLLLEGSSSTLQQIQIENCDKFAVLPAWLQNLTSLHKLEIIECPRLLTLPGGMDHLTGLRQLRIRACPNLGLRCQKDGRGRLAQNCSHPGDRC